MDPQRLPRVSLDLLRGFRAAARHLSFTRAAHELFVTQSAISHQVKALEDQLGRPLFRRVNRALELTEAGEQLFRAVDEGLTLIDNATQRVAGTSRTLSVTTTVAMASTWLAPRLPRFQQANPEIDLRIVASNEWLDLQRDQIDVAIRFATLQMPTPRGEKIFDYLQFPVCSPALARDRTRPLRSIDDLGNHVLIDFETAVYGRPWYDWQLWFDAKGLRRPRTAGWMRLSHYDQVIQAARKGTGVAVGKWPHLADTLRDGELVAPLGDAGVATVGAFFLELAGTQREAAASFTDWLRNVARQEEAAATAGRAARKRGKSAKSSRAR